MTKAPVPKPPSKSKASFLGHLPDMPAMRLAEQVPDNLDEDSYANLNFRVEPDFKKEFKITAAVAGISMRDLLEESFKCWKKARNSESAK